MSFDRLAGSYRWMELVLAGETLQASRTQWLPAVSAARRVLIVGEGPGRFLEVCAKTMPEAEFTVVDASQNMLALAEAAWNRVAETHQRPRPRAAFIHASLPQWSPPGGQFDLVATHFFLDCFGPQTLAQVIALLASAAAEESSWIVTDFCVPARGFARWRSLLILRAAYGFFRLATRLEARRITPPDPFLAAAGYTLANRRHRQWGLLHSDLWVRKSGREPIVIS